ncbi:hypothetical protein ACSNN7_20580 [Micromonospora sp. URMC 105]|uniref:hypothetical protein n=1 Tax=Micromonospora sp. URMC 105 TaxID=3423413 RepID=UPI003F1B67D0
MIDRKLLLSDLQKQVKNLEKDLREQAESVEEVRLSEAARKTYALLQRPEFVGAFHRPKAIRGRKAKA